MVTILSYGWFTAFLLDPYDPYAAGMYISLVLAEQSEPPTATVETAALVCVSASMT